MHHLITTNPSTKVAGYHSPSMLAFPLTNFQNKMIIRVQLINRHTGKKRQPVGFNDKQSDLIFKFNQIIN